MREEPRQDDAPRIVANSVEVWNDQTGREVDRDDKQQKERAKRNDLRQEELPERNRQGGEDQIIAPIRKQRIPFERHDKAHHDHRVTNEGVTVAGPQPHARDFRTYQWMIDKQKQRDDGAGQRQHGDDLDDVRVLVSIGRNRVFIEESAEEGLNQSGELLTVGLLLMPAPYRAGASPGQPISVHRFAAFLIGRWPV